MAEVQRDNIGSREDTLRFLDMVGLFSSQAMIGLGKVVNPSTGKAEKNLLAARLFIDTLEMLEHKTKGNLNADETKFLRATLTDLRLMYVEESKITDTGGSRSVATVPTTGEPGAGEAAEPPKSAEPKPQPEPDAESKVKFHKKYE